VKNTVKGKLKRAQDWEKLLYPDGLLRGAMGKYYVRKKYGVRKTVGKGVSLAP